MSTIAFILRGRPGLGHVIPGLAIADEVRAMGAETVVISYDNGSQFLRTSDYPGTVIDLTVRPSYEDWPGLDLYDDGLGRLAHILTERSVDLIVLGGEYLLTPLGQMLGVPTVLLYNPEILEDTFQNRFSARLFSAMLAHCDALLPLYELNRRMVAQAASIRQRNLVSGPFWLAGSAAEASARSEERGLTVLIGNGGGLSLPTDTRSYSSNGTGADRWREHTELATVEALRGALSAAEPYDTIQVFSCLPEQSNARLRELTGELTGSRHAVCRPSRRYYDCMTRADVLVIRAGTGAVADALRTTAETVVWPLPGHDEQLANAVTLTRSRPGAVMVTDPAGIPDAVRAAMRTARDRRAALRTRPPAPHPPPRAAIAARQLMDRLVAVRSE